ncbi:glycosyltransferase [Pantoea sp. GD03673]|uniref:glycosyltransferase n=1 Tax=Pantoea sp. GD03673 TaxID=2975364 RepID=UPI00244A1901|nr:glycosyltransferase [Pantoea sp. GD03673]MDH2066267.1 glycosyltransferase [Pantoea sp. GD03673]
MHQHDLVSIIITAGASAWFTRALDSALSQDYPHIEIIVADYSDAPFIHKKLESYLDQHGHLLRYVKIDDETGPVYQAAVSAARGKYIKFLSDADLLKPVCVSTLVAGLMAHPACRVAISRRERIGPQDEVLPELISTSALNSENCIINGQDLLRNQTLKAYSLPGELTAALFYRDDLTSSLIDQSLLTTGEPALQAVPALVIYHHHLSHSHLLWFAAPLCSVRASDVEFQPHQRESDDIFRNGREALYEKIRHESGFDVGHDPQLVRVASLAQPDLFSLKNLAEEQQKNFTLGTLATWRGSRTLNPLQHKMLVDLAATHAHPISVLAVITVTHDTAAGLDALLRSISQTATVGIRFEPVIIAIDVIPDTDAECYAATEQSRIPVINQLIHEREDQWVMFLEATTVLHASGVIALSKMLLAENTCLALYADEFFYIDNAPMGAAFRPDFNLDLLLSSPKTMAQHWLFRRELLLAAEGLDADYPASAEFDLIVKLIESQGFDSIGHSAEPLLTGQLKSRDILEDVAIIERHLQNRGYPDGRAALDNFFNYRLRYNHPDKPVVSIIILANWHLASLISCVTTVLEKTTYHRYEMIIICDNQGTPERDKWVSDIAGVDPARIKTARFNGAFRHSAMANLAAEQATGDYLLFMHCEMAVTDGEWLDNLLNHGLRPEVFAVGGKHLSSDNKIRHAGYVLGVNGAVGEVFRGNDDKDANYLGRMNVDQNYSAVSGDLVLMRKSVFDELGGFDQDKRLYADVDLCLKARELGYLTVWTPYARLHRPAARTSPFPDETVQTSSKLKQLEEDKIYAEWMPVVASDPAYNPNLSLRSRHFELRNDDVNGLTVRAENLPTFLAHNADVYGCGHYRITQPLEAMIAEGVAQGKSGMTLLTLSEMGQFRPDSLIIQRRYAPAFHNWMERVSKLHNVFKVFELDDYIINLPMKHHGRHAYKQETAKLVRKSLSFFDRFVVSTAPLADAMRDMHPDIVVMKNRLPSEAWGRLHSLRQQGKKPRVGWAGGVSHRGDLEMIFDIVREFSADVEWVFMGMCPDKLRPYVHEVHSGVDLTLYPAALASLNLDLALAPVEDNIFNACKSNLRLLEYGACGVPVICSNVACYRDDNLPVTRVNNRFIDWREAIRMHLADPDASAKMGRELQAEIRQNWMLTGESLRLWAKAWQP